MAKGSKKPLDRREALRKKRNLWKQTTEEWKNVLQLRGIGNVRVIGQSRITMCCPFHSESNPSAHIFLDKKLFRCYAGSCNARFMDPIQFVQKLLGLSYKQAAEEFKSLFSSTEFLKNDHVEFFTEENTRFKRMKLLSDAFHDNLVAAWTDMSPPESTRNTINWLKNVRDVSDISTIHSLGLFPRAADLKKFFKGNEEDLKWAFEYLGKYLDNRYVDTVVFTYAISPDEITAFKLRHPTNPNQLPVLIKDEDEPLGVFGLTNGAFLPLINNDDTTQATVVEGEFDQISIFKNQVKTAPQEVTIAASGGGHAGLDLLADNGLNRAKIIADDDKGGESFIIGLLKKSKRVACQIFEWDDKLQIPNTNLDPDLAIKTYGFAQMNRLFQDDASYKYPPRWCKERADEELVNIDDEDVRRQEEIAIKFGNLINNETELLAYCDLISDSYALLTAPGVFKHIRQSDDSELGFINSIASWIRRKLHVVYVDSSENFLHLWNKDKRKPVVVNLNSFRSLIATFQQQIKGSPVEWARDEIGLPSYYPPIEMVGEEKGKFDYVQKQVHNRIQDALGLLSSEAAEKPYAFLSQGIHLKDIDIPSTPGYVVNGDRIYKLMWNHDGTQLASVVELEGPADGQTIFDLEVRQQISLERNGSWLPSIRSEKDFFTTPKYSLRECYDRIFEIINSVSEFKYQSSDSQYCTLLVFYSYLIDSMQRRVMTHLHGEFESGKSSVLSLLSGSLQLPEFHLTYHATTMDQYTVPGVFQALSGTKLLVGLDEANDKGDEVNNKIRNLLESFRGLATKGIADRTLGSTGQKAKSQFLYNAIITASATEIHDDMDYSRFRTIQLVKNPNKANTRVLLNQKFGTDLFEDLRASVFYNTIHAAPRIAQIYKELPLEYGDGTKHKLDRSVDGLLPLAAIGKHIGIDYNAFIMEFCSNREEDHQMRKTSRDGYELLDKLINSPKMKITIPGTDERRDMSLRSALRDHNMRKDISSSECGIYYDEKEKCIGVAWDQALLSVLTGTKYGRNNANRLRQLAYQTPYHVDRELAKQSGLYDRLMAQGLAGSTIFSFFNISKYVTQIENAYKASLTATNPAPDTGDTESDEDDVASGMNL